MVPPTKAAQVETKNTWHKRNLMWAFVKCSLCSPLMVIPCLHWYSSKLFFTHRMLRVLLKISLYNSMSSSPELRSAGLLNSGLKVCSLGAVNWGWGGGLLIGGTGVGVCLLTANCLRCCFCKESFSLWVRGSSGGRHSTNSIQQQLLQRWVKKSVLSWISFLWAQCC